MTMSDVITEEDAVLCDVITEEDTVLSGHTNDVNSCDCSAGGLLVTSSRSVTA